MGKTKKLKKGIIVHAQLRMGNTTIGGELLVANTSPGQTKRNPPFTVLMRHANCHSIAPGVVRQPTPLYQGEALFDIALQWCDAACCPSLYKGRSSLTW